VVKKGSERARHDIERHADIRIAIIHIALRRPPNGLRRNPRRDSCCRFRSIKFPSSPSSFRCGERVFA
jgi:hypothetical protein